MPLKLSVIVVLVLSMAKIAQTTLSTPQPGFEPGTNRLTADRSTAELLRKASFMIVRGGSPVQYLDWHDLPLHDPQLLGGGDPGGIKAC